MSDNNHIELRSEEVQEILGTPPRWIIRWGITIMLLVVLVLLTGSYFYKYPDIISARVTILSENPPVQIVAKSNGKLDQLFVENNQHVESDEILGVVENTANYKDAYRLLEKLQTIGLWFNSPVQFNEISFSEHYSLGQYHPYLSSFESQLRSYQTFLTYNPYNQRIESLQKQVQDYKNYFERSRDQIVVLRQDYELAFNQFYRDSTLYRQQIMSEVDYEKSKAAMLKQKYSYQNAMTGLANTQITMNNLQQQIQEQEVLKAEAGSQLLATLKERYDNLNNQLKEWEQLYVLKTPIQGRITFTSVWSPNQFINAGDVVFTVVPEKEQTIIGRATVPIAGAGKVEVGQRVNIKLDNYPHIEYGIVSGRVTNISMVPVITDKGAFYTAEISLENSLVTNYNRELPFNQEMQGEAEIVTKDRRLLERLIEPLVSIMRERM
ncbi:Multidrug resistance efflux pump [Mariniphaga anaerophila]|uniref:Multidrug resistance efflux pump n=1 Tax=Mariniphaga anaerophila TaxID=1484053 RepID=A0A1M4TFA0_9BACT|nr:HlyD family efflux transporter periplasmic adaptor subunit [Mariniphaga anaerophila]SHE43182.1 Multidrug resistance efflux pump [Mariniphaga anaerophila]